MSRNKLSFRGNNTSFKGIVSTVLSAIAWILFMIAAIISAVQSGEAGESVGVLGTISLAMGIIGSVLSMMAFRDRGVSYRYPMAGLISNMILLMALLSLLLTGINI